jgi:hypothetical protein
MTLNPHGRRSASLSRSVDADLIISVVALALVGLIGANTWILLSVRDRVGKVDRRVEGQNQRITKVIEWAEGQVSLKRSR